ncbi:MAG: HesB/IscA family protein [Candidatus Eiseniibacteriota bacterium]
MADSQTSAPPRAGRPLLTVTPKAVARAKSLLARHAKPAGTGFRVGVRGGGCSGLTYAIDFESETRKGDHVLEAEDVRFYLDIKSQLFLAGTTLDYVETLMDRSFQFINPNAKRSCSCGESFTV